MTALDSLHDRSVRLLPSLTSLRAFAAVAVAIHHTRHTWAHFAVIDWVAHFGYLGVSCFFILSGFVLMWGYRPATRYSDFVLRRLIRIYPLHFICLLVSLALFFLAGRPMGGYVGTPWGTVANFLLVHGWIPGNPDIRQAWNGVSWTLSCELFFYLLAPPVFKLMLQAGSPIILLRSIAGIWSVLLLIAIAGANEHWDAWMDFSLYSPAINFLYFVLGACGAMLMKVGWRFHSRGLAIGLMLLPVWLYDLFASEAGGHQYGAIAILLFAPGAFLVVMSLARVDVEEKFSWTQNRTLVFLGEASYALYMTHAMLLAVIARNGSPFFSAASTSILWGELDTLIYLAMAMGLSVIAHLYFELPVRSWLMRRLQQFKATRI